MNEKECYNKLYGNLSNCVKSHKLKFMEKYELDKEREKKNHKIRYFFYYELYLPLSRIWRNHISMLHKEIYWFFQRGFRGYSDSDCWSFDYYIAKVIRDAIKHLKKNKLGYPCLESFPKDREPTSEEETVLLAEWHSILDTIIYAYDMIVKEGNGDVYFWYKDCEKFYEALRNNHLELYKNVKFLTEEEQKKVDLGQQLFVKHFFDFWD